MKSKFLRSLYDRSISGLPALGTPEAVVAGVSGGSQQARAEAIISHYTRWGGAAGFVSGLPGFLLLPVTLPANLIGVAAIQLHMTASLALLGGHDPRSPRVREQALNCLKARVTRDGSNSGTQEVGRRTLVKVAERSGRYAAMMSQSFFGRRVRSFLIRRVGSKLVPIVGGAIGAGTDAYLTRHVGRRAVDEFVTPADAPALAR